MVSKRRLDYGFSGYQIPVVPKAPRSVRRRGPRKKLVEDSKICAFELLAAVAGKLLQESEGSASSNAAEGKDQPSIVRYDTKKVKSDDVSPPKSDCFDHGSCAESSFMPDITPKEHNFLTNFKGLPQAENDSAVEHASAFTSSGLSEKVGCDMKLGICKEKKMEDNIPCKLEGGSFYRGDSCTGKVENGLEKQVEDGTGQLGDLTLANTFNVKDTVDECVNNNILINSDSSVHLPLYRDPTPEAFNQKHGSNVKLGIRDDDDNSFGCKKPGTKIRALRPQPPSGHRRVRKMLASKYWKMAPRLKDYELYNTSEGMKTFYRCRKGIFARERYQRVPIKKRKLCNESYGGAHDQEASSESISNLPHKGVKGDKNSSATYLDRACEASALMKSHKKSKDANVKFSIRSFRVPELYIEVPETATVGSLKRTVMEAVTAILGGGLRVGVVHRGKKVRDDNRTLEQAGINQGGGMDTLGFTLEPSFSQVSPSKTPKDLPLMLSCDGDQQLSGSPASPMLDSGLSNASLDHPSMSKPEKNVDFNRESVVSPKTPVDTLTAEAVGDSKALVPIPPMNEPLAMVPANPKPKRNELSHRRTRRPFSVGEVEALVEAVEKLGTGRWRDVKMRAFENADHRTYVDLKDKWKTLVHTASISPQQRRGEPVPQDLLDRVLSAHSYWSQHQSKQHGKHLVEPLKIVDGQMEMVGA